MVRFVDSGDESDVESGDGLAPVTPLFGDRAARSFPKTADEVRRALEDRVPAATRAANAPPPPESDWRPPVSPAGSRTPPTDATEPTPPPVPGAGWHRPPASDAEWHTEGEEESSAGAPAVSHPVPIDIAAERDGRTGSRTRERSGSRTRERSVGRASTEDDPAEAAERGLLKKLRGRQLSVSEAKSYLGQYELHTEAVDAILEAFLGRGYLDDARLAEQVVHAGVDRKGQGRQVIAQSLAKRGVPRDVADAALTELPDDDAERALEFARTKAGSMRGLERDVALRRLAGQLARRGYGGSVALNAARAALDETARPSGRVRFEER